jgi:hypothetical protein
MHTATRIVTAKENSNPLGKKKVKADGSGTSPNALSTIIFKGTGTSKARGTAIKFKTKIPVICGQYALPWVSILLISENDE